MTDLTSKTVEDVDNLIQKYTPLLEVSGVKTINEMQVLAFIIDIGIKYVKEKYNNLSIDWKSWTIVALKQKRNKLKTTEDVMNTVDDFVKYYKSEYQKYRNSMSEYNLEELDCHFVSLFTEKY